MGNFSLSGTFTNMHDPDYQPYPRENGGFIGGKPLRQGWESGELKYPPLPSAEYNELYSRWTALSTGKQSGTLPHLSGYTWQTVSAWYLQPLPTGWDGQVAHGVTQRVTHVERF